jgi:PAS domain S-box-containing protein
MKKRPNRATKTITRRRAADEAPLSSLEAEHQPMMAELRQRAEASLRAQRKQQRLKDAAPAAATAPERLLHELQVHQIELELQNTELRRTRDELETSLEQYTNLYDFAPAGYFSLDESAMILQVNLAGASLLGVERSRLTRRRLTQFVTAAGRPRLTAFLEQVFAGSGNHVCEMELLRPGAAPFWASIHGVAAIAMHSEKKCCRLVVSDLTPLREAQEVKRRLEDVALTNQELQQEIVRRQAVEEALKESEQQQKQLLEQSHQMQQQLRNLSRQILRAQEDERRTISRELHDVIAQTLTGIHIHLASLTGNGATVNTNGLVRHVEATQRLVEHAVGIVQQFTRDLRPAVLDDLGLIPALQTFMKQFTTRTGIRTHLTASATVEQLDANRRTTLFRVAQEALTNVARHARASRVEVDIRRRSGQVRIKICDNGESFDVQRAMQPQETKHLGLLGMRERLEMVGGQFAVESIPGRGTTIKGQIPFPKTARLQRRGTRKRE